MLANQSFAEGRTSETEHVQNLKTLDLIFDDDTYVQAQKMLAGVDRAAFVNYKRFVAGQTKT